MPKVFVKYGSVYYDETPERWKFAGESQLTSIHQISPITVAPNDPIDICALLRFNSTDFSGVLGFSFSPADENTVTFTINYMNKLVFSDRGLALGLSEEEAQQVLDTANELISSTDIWFPGVYDFNVGVVDHLTSLAFYRWLTSALLYLHNPTLNQNTDPVEIVEDAKQIWR